MLVATFGPTTAWHGRQIIWDVDHFILVGHGRIPAAGLLDYAARSQLVWADPGYRAWVVSVDRWERGGTAGGRQVAAQPGGAGSAAQPRRGGIPSWVVAVSVVGVVALIVAVALVALVPAAFHRAVDDFGQDMQVDAAVHTLQSGIDAYALEHNGRYPKPGELDPVDMARYVTAWPVNPYTGFPIADGGGEGNFRYAVSADGGAYKIIGYGRGGRVVLQLGGSATDTV